MARKKQEIALQAEIETQEEWEDMLAKEGLTVVDIYQEWTGPCKAMVSIFRRLKNELGDDLLRFSVGGVLVAIVRGCNSPLLLKTITEQLAHEHKVLEGNAERKEIKDPLLASMATKDKQEEEEEEEEEELDEDGHVRTPSPRKVPAEETEQRKGVTMAIIKPDVVADGRVDEVLEKLKEAGIEVLEHIERTMSDEEAREFYAHRKDEEYFEGLVSFMTGGPSHFLILTKGDTGEGIIEEWRELLGPASVEEAKEQAPESFRANFGKENYVNALHGSDSQDTAMRELAFFFPEFVVPTIPGQGKAKKAVKVERTLALIRPDAMAEKKDEILDKIKEAGFSVAMAKEITLSKEQAEEFYKEHQGQEYFEELTNRMCSGPLLALALARDDAVSGWREMLGPKEVDEAKEKAPQSLRAQYSVEGVPINTLHGSDTAENAEKELEYFFPMQQTVAVIKPDGYQTKDEIMDRIREAGFHIAARKETELTKDVAEQFYKDHEGKEYYGDLVEHMTSGPTLFMVLSKEDAVDGWRSLLGPTDPSQAKEKAPDTLRAKFGTDIKQNAVHGSSNVDQAKNSIKLVFGDLEFNKDGTLKTPLEEGAEGEGEKSQETTQAEGEGQQDEDQFENESVQSPRPDSQLITDSNNGIGSQTNLNNKSQDDDDGASQNNSTRDYQNERRGSERSQVSGNSTQQENRGDNIMEGQSMHEGRSTRPGSRQSMHEGRSTRPGSGQLDVFVEQGENNKVSSRPGSIRSGTGPGSIRSDTKSHSEKGDNAEPEEKVFKVLDEGVKSEDDGDVDDSQSKVSDNCSTEGKQDNTEQEEIEQPNEDKYESTEQGKAQSTKGEVTEQEEKPKLNEDTKNIKPKTKKGTKSMSSISSVKSDTSKKSVVSQSPDKNQTKQPSPAKSQATQLSPAKNQTTQPSPARSKRSSLASPARSTTSRKSTTSSKGSISSIKPKTSGNKNSSAKSDKTQKGTDDSQKKDGSMDEGMAASGSIDTLDRYLNDMGDDDSVEKDGVSSGNGSQMGDNNSVDMELTLQKELTAISEKAEGHDTNITVEDEEGALGRACDRPKSAAVKSERSLHSRRSSARSYISVKTPESPVDYNLSRESSELMANLSQSRQSLQSQTTLQDLTQTPTKSFQSNVSPAKSQQSDHLGSPTGSPRSNESPTGSPRSGSPRSNVSPTRSPRSNISPTGSPRPNISTTGSPRSNVSPTGSPKSNISPTGSPRSNISPTRSPRSNVSPTGSQKSLKTPSRSLKSNTPLTKSNQSLHSVDSPSRLSYRSSQSILSVKSSSSKLSLKISDTLTDEQIRASLSRLNKQKEERTTPVKANTGGQIRDERTTPVKPNTGGQIRDERTTPVKPNTGGQIRDERTTPVKPNTGGQIRDESSLSQSSLRRDSVTSVKSGSISDEKYQQNVGINNLQSAAASHPSSIKGDQCEVLSEGEDKTEDEQAVKKDVEGEENKEQETTEESKEAEGEGEQEKPSEETKEGEDAEGGEQKEEQQANETDEQKQEGTEEGEKGETTEEKKDDEAEQKPTESEDKPADGAEQTQEEGGDKPAEEEQKPAESDEKPAEDSEQKPAEETTQKTPEPTQSEEKPEPEQSEQKPEPEQTEEKPAESEEKPAEEQKPAESEEQAPEPAQTDEKPAEGEEKKEDEEQKEAESAEQKQDGE